MNPGNPVIQDTLNWVKVSGCYLAQGGEEYLTIGNFFDNANTQITAGNGSSYYYVDDVLVEEITGSCTTGISELLMNEMKLSPNPVENSLHITASDLKNKEALTVKLYDVLGKEALSAVYKEELDLSGLEKGIYFLSLYQDNQLLVTKKVVKE
jgi:hypothetical protein